MELLQIFKKKSHNQSTVLPNLKQLREKKKKRFRDLVLERKNEKSKERLFVALKLAAKYKTTSLSSATLFPSVKLLRGVGCPACCTGVFGLAEMSSFSPQQPLQCCALHW